MSVIYTRTTQLFHKELQQQQKLTHNPEDMLLKNKERKHVQKLYIGDTSKFEPTIENREHLIKSMLPMVLHLAKLHAKKYDHKIELNDCISSGLYGATIATDIYIRKSTTTVQPAKLSTYAHFYIKKYIIEYCRNNMTILSCGPTKVREALSIAVFEGNRQLNKENGNSEFFDNCSDNAVLTEIEPTKMEEASYASEKLLQGLSTTQKNILVLAFGIATNDGQPLSSKQIAKKLNIRSSTIKPTLDETLQLLQNKFSNSDSINILDALRGISFTNIKHWNVSMTN